MRFLLPVYLIPLVELSPHSTTSPATIDKGTVKTSQSKCCIVTCVVKELLKFIKKESFSRGSDGPPRKLMKQEARAMQQST